MQGWRFFCCDDCGEIWKAATRDHLSPSIDACPCGSEIAPYASEPDPSLPVDRMGNLIGPYKQIYLASSDVD